MFGFFKTIKTEVEALKARFTALEQKVEAFFTPKTTPTASGEVKNAAEQKQD